MASVFLESIRDFMTTRRYAKRTIDTYQYWIKFYILYILKNIQRNWQSRRLSNSYLI